MSEKTLKGKVSRISPYGFQVDGEDQWYNYDKHNKPKPPVKDWHIEFVCKEVNGKLYVNKITPLNQESADTPVSSGTSGGGSRSESIERQCAWKGACEVAKERKEMKADDIVALAKAGYEFISGQLKEGFSGAEEVKMSELD